jgi:hypothetical protein
MKNEKNENVPVLDQELHERLCAYVFGELAGAERAAFEAELARPTVQAGALRAEHARLAATIGLVQAAVPDERLSEAVRRDLVASARRSRFRVVSRRRMALLAAAAVVVVSGAFAWRYLSGTAYGPAPRGRDVKVARSEAPERTVERDLAAKPASRMRERKDEADQLAALRGLGYGGGEASAPAPAAAVPPVDSPAAVQSLGLAEGHRPYSPAESPDAQEAAGAFFLGHGEKKSAAEAPVATESRSSGHVGGRHARRYAADSRGGNGEKGEVSAASTDAARAKSVAGAGAPGSPGATATGSEDGFYLGPPDFYLGPSDTAPSVASEPPPPAETEALGVEPASLAKEALRSLDDLGYGGEGEEGRPDFNNNDLGGFVGVDTGGSDEAKLNQRRNQREPVLTREQVVDQIDRLLGSSRLAPGESPRDMFFRYFADAPFVLALEERT